MPYISGNITGNQNSYSPQVQAPQYPISEGTASLNGPFGMGQAYVRGAGTVQMGPAGVSTSVPFAPGFSATPANTVNGLGEASPFATSNQYLDQLGMNTFGQTNPYSPLYGTPWDAPNNVMPPGFFGGQQDAPFGGGFGGAPSFGGSGSVPGFGSGFPFNGAGSAPGANGASGNSSPNLFGDPSLFGSVSPNVIPGIAQTFSQSGGGYANRYNLVSDGAGKLFLQGQGDPNTPQSTYGSGSYLRTPYGIFETGVGWEGGNANAGLMGTQASGQAWAMSRNPVNPAIVTGYSNPYYSNYNFNQGFTNA